MANGVVTVMKLLLLVAVNSQLDCVETSMRPVPGLAENSWLVVPSE